MTYIEDSIRPLGVFLGIEDGQTIVFCCSLQEAAISSKILSDVKIICRNRNSTPVDRIVYFTEADVPVSTRHRLIEAAIQTYDVQLTVIDGDGLSELLSEPENIWIPVEYLNISLDLLSGSELATVMRELFATGEIIVRPLGQLDPVRDLGVHPPMKLTSWHDLPEYVPRTMDADIDAAIGESGLLVIEGGSTSGKTRTAYEAILRSTERTGERPVVIPRDGRSLRRLIAAGYSLENSIVWLDDLEKFIGSDGIDEGIVRLLSVNSGVIFMATLRSRAKAAMESAVAGPSGRSLSSISKSVLAGATVLRVERDLNLEERKAANSHVDDPRISAALSSESAGFAEHIAAAPATLVRWRDGRDGANEVGAALVSAAVDLRRAGYFSPIPREWLNVIYPAYLDPRIRERAVEERIDFGFSWATQMVSGASSCLEVIGKDLFSPFDYLVDFTQQEHRDGETSSPSHHLGDIPDLVWHELADRISADDPSFMSCVSVSSLSLHPALKYFYDRAVSDGQISIDSLKDRGVLLNFVRSCAVANLCIVCQASLHNLDIASILSVLLEECAPVLANPDRLPTQSQVESVRALASMGEDSGLENPDAPLHQAALQVPPDKWAQLAQFMLSVGVNGGRYWMCFAEFQEGRIPNWPTRDLTSNSFFVPPYLVSRDREREEPM